MKSRRNPIGRWRPPPRVIEQPPRAMIALTRSTVATARDPVLVPERFATGVGQLLGVYLIATEAAAG